LKNLNGITRISRDIHADSRTLSSGDFISSRELAKRVRDKYYFQLPKELLDKKTSTGTNVLIDRILWGNPI